MTARAFLNTGYAMLVAEYQHLGMDMQSAVTRVDESIGLIERQDVVAVPDRGDRVPSPAENAAALKQLEATMKGLAR